MQQWTGVFHWPVETLVKRCPERFVQDLVCQNKILADPEVLGEFYDALVDILTDTPSGLIVLCPFPHTLWSWLAHLLPEGGLQWRYERVIDGFQPKIGEVC